VVNINNITQVIRATD